MAGDWETLTVDQIKAPGDRSIAIGPFGSRMKASVYVSSGVPVIRGNNISDTRALVRDFVFVSDRTADELRACNLRAGDLVFPHRGSIGEVAIVPNDGIARYMLSTSLMKLTCDSQRVDPNYVFYFFRSPEGRHALLQHSSTVGTPGIGQPLTSLRSIRVRIPPLPEQRAIAHILGTLDDKIDVNRRMSESLEAIARALFRSWFVNFDPVRAKTEGWRFEEMGRHIELSRGFSYDGASIAEGGAPFHNLNSIFEGGGYKFGGIKSLSVEFDDRRAVEPGDVIVANTEQGHERLLLGSAALIPRRYGPRTPFSHHLYRVRVRPDSPLRPMFVLHLLNDPWMHDLVSRYGNGTTVNMLPTDALELPLIAVPPARLVAQFEEIALPLHHRAEAALMESECLSALRDALLPTLISGELRTDAQRFQEPSNSRSQVSRRS